MWMKQAEHLVEAINFSDGLDVGLTNEVPTLEHTLEFSGQNTAILLRSNGKLSKLFFDNT